jgi:hypothetical protein
MLSVFAAALYPIAPGRGAPCRHFRATATRGLGAMQNGRMTENANATTEKLAAFSETLKSMSGSRVDSGGNP